jgi:hypothetical protein
MFCPGCGLNEERAVQFCRACGADLGAVRESLERAEAAEPSVTAAREEIARAIAARIKEGQWWQVGALAPEAEKLFESLRERRARLRRRDEEQRLARLRGGTITAAVGLGLVLLFQLLRVMDDRAVILIGPSLLVLLVGLGVILNGLLFTVPKSAALPEAGAGRAASAPHGERHERARRAARRTRRAPSLIHPHVRHRAHDASPSRRNSQDAAARLKPGRRGSKL